jgi:hypothetical protein
MAKLQSLIMSLPQLTKPELRTLRVCPKTSGGITEFSEHEAD